MDIKSTNSAYYRWKDVVFVPKEKENYRDVLADVVEVTGKRILGVYDIMRYLKIGHNKAITYLDGSKSITAHKFAQKLI